MASKNYDNGIKKIIDRTIDLAGDTLKIMLVTTGYTFLQTETAMTTAAASELSVTGYTSGFASASRRTLASKTMTNDTTNHRTIFTATSPATWTALAAGATIAGAIVYKHITDDATSIPITFLDFTDTATNGSDFTLTYDATTGIWCINN